MKALWDHIAKCQGQFDSFLATKWNDTNPGEMDEKTKKLLKGLKEMKVDKRANAYIGIMDGIKKWIIFLPLIEDLRNDAMRERHWDSLKQKIGVQFEINDKLLLSFIYELDLGKFQEDVEEIADQAKQEKRMEVTLDRLEKEWRPRAFEFTPHKDSGFHLLKLNEEDVEALENDVTAVSAMFSSRYLATFEEKINYWNKALANIGEIVSIMSEVQRQWSFLENLFMHSEEVKKELPNESQKFIGIDKETKSVLAEAYKSKICLDFCTRDHVLPILDKIRGDLQICEVALNDFVYSKRVAFARFFFVSQTDLLDILSNGNVPTKVMKHMPKIFGAIETLELIEEGVRPSVQGMHACIGVEYVKFTKELKLLGKVEVYLQWVIDTMRSSLKDITTENMKIMGTGDKLLWIKDTPSQVLLLLNNANWVINCEKAFMAAQNGEKDSMEKCYDNQVEDLSGLIGMVTHPSVDKPLRTKLMCLITMDAHSRDMIRDMRDGGCRHKDHFLW